MALVYYLPLLFCLFLLPLCNCADSIGEFCNKDKSLSGSNAPANRDRVLAELAAKASLTSFATASSGVGPETVYGLVQCRGDVSPQDCSTCISDAVKKLPENCPNEADARIWYDYCFLRYDTRDFIGELDTGVGILYLNVENVTDPEAFDKELGALMGRVRAQATVPLNKGLGKDKTQFSPFITIYGLAQCNRDLSRQSCAQCLAIAVSKFPEICKYSKGCQVNYSSCRVRYEIYPFFFPLDSSKSKVGISSRFMLYP